MQSANMSTKNRTSLSSLRIISLLTIDLFLLSCTATALILPYIPIKIDVFGLASYYSCYLQMSALVAIAGLWGAFRKSPVLTSLFSSYLFLDLLISALPRILLLISIFTPSPSSGLSTNEPPTILSSTIADPSGIPLLDGFLIEVVVALQHSWIDATCGMSATSYNILTVFLKLCFVVILGLCSGLQVAAGYCVRGYAARLARLPCEAWERRGSLPEVVSGSDLDEWEEYRHRADEKFT